MLPTLGQSDLIPFSFQELRRVKHDLGGRPGLPVRLKVLMVSVDVKQH